MKAKWIIMRFMAVLSLVGCTRVPPGLEPVTGFELNRYLGRWYEIARLDHRFERNMSNVSAHYSRKEGGGIRLVNRGFDEKSGKWKEIEGRGYFIGDDKVGSFKVSFLGPFYGGYHIIALDREDYLYSMVTGPKRSYLWILCRQKMLDSKVLEYLVEKAKGLGFEVETLIYVKHEHTDPSLSRKVPQALEQERNGNPNY